MELAIIDHEVGVAIDGAANEVEPDLGRGRGGLAGRGARDEEADAAETGCFCCCTGDGEVPDVDRVEAATEAEVAWRAGQIRRLGLPGLGGRPSRFGRVGTSC